MLKLLAVSAMSFGGMQWADARELVILQTNDTHSQIDPTDKGYGGVQRRKVFVDSVRATGRMCCLSMPVTRCRAHCSSRCMVVRWR